MSGLPLLQVTRLAWPVVELRSPMDRSSSTAAIGGLLAQVANGDQNAFAVLFDRVAGPVIGIIKRVVRDQAMSEEVAQEVMLEVWRNAPRFDPALGSGFSWILTMAHRRAVDRVRSEQASRDRTARVAPSHLEIPHDSVEEAALRGDETAAVQQALARLSEAQRIAIELAYYDGLTQNEIAVQLGIPLGTVKTRIRDGMSRLRETLRSDR